MIFLLQRAVHRGLPDLISLMFVVVFSPRLADHFGGKLHMGFIKIRERLKELQVNLSRYFLVNFVTIRKFNIAILLTDPLSLSAAPNG